MNTPLTKQEHPMRAEYPVLFEDLEDLIRRYGSTLLLRALDVISEEENGG